MRIYHTHRRTTTVAIGLSFVFHLLLALFVGITIRTQVEPFIDLVLVHWVDVPPETVREVLKKRPIDAVQPEQLRNRAKIPSDQPRLELPTPKQGIQTPHPVLANSADPFAKVPDVLPSPVTTAAALLASPNAPSIATSSALPDMTAGTGTISSVQPNPRSNLPSRASGIASIVGKPTGVTADPADLSAAKFAELILIPNEKLGAVLIGEGADVQGHIRLIRLKHSLSDWWQDPTAIPSFMKWLAENTRLKADLKYAGGHLSLTDERILDAPLVFMTGHDKDIAVGRNLIKDGPLTDAFTPDERAMLRKYIIERGGTLFFDDCGFNGLFAAQVASELTAIFPEYPLENIPHSHEIYRIYYQLPVPPTGGDVFWGSENNPKASRFKYQKGITIGNRLAVVYNRKDYMCAMETAEIPSRTMLRMRRSTDVHRFMTNLLFYAMKYGGNTDRSGYTP